jgi:hypothetical protein
MLTIGLAGCPGTLDPNQFPPQGGGGSSGSPQGSAGTGNTSGMAGMGAAGMGAAGTGMAGSGAAGSGAGGAVGTCDIMPILIGDGTTGNCAQTACHDANGTSAGFSMTGDWQSKLVNVVPKGGGALMSVCAKDPTAKTVPYIIKGNAQGDGLFLRKLKGGACTAGSVMGAIMPFGAMPGMGTLSTDQYNCVQKWAANLATQ